jgi:hypothetical protein
MYPTTTTFTLEMSFTLDHFMVEVLESLLMWWCLFTGSEQGSFMSGINCRVLVFCSYFHCYHLCDFCKEVLILKVFNVICCWWWSFVVSMFLFTCFDFVGFSSVRRGAHQMNDTASPLALPASSSPHERDK